MTGRHPSSPTGSPEGACDAPDRDSDRGAVQEPANRPAQADAAFPAAFRDELDQLFRWRRDVRRFRRDPVPEDALDRAMTAFGLSPSVGLSEPWRIIRMDSAAARAAALANFEAANAEALAGYSGDRAALYAGLKLSGMREAPVQLAVFCDGGTGKGAGLGARTMPEARAYSVVAAITCLWLSLRAGGLGMGWVSIIDPVQLRADLNLPDDWQLVGYLCIGWPEITDDQPELQRAGWESRSPVTAIERR